MCDVCYDVGWSTGAVLALHRSILNKMCKAEIASSSRTSNACGWTCKWRDCECDVRKGLETVDAHRGVATAGGVSFTNSSFRIVVRRAVRRHRLGRDESVLLISVPSVLRGGGRSPTARPLGPLTCLS
ncbi:hypothetical protein EVAR_80935_1 [Eumeta japonica]|uniref:Uncharacterized protein n=1 Tax=Eumeta variegata TaxID=151549 RepID=A0A4C1V1K7_EUMVA|nr:hypothetical protein EVAR_80935_1 [Eumeta japonica]